MLGLVLGGGAAKGYAHIGVIKVLDEMGIRPDVVVGASMGAVIGGFYAAGFSGSRMEEIARGIDRKTKRRFFPFRLLRGGFVDGRNIVRFLEGHLGDRSIESLGVRYAAVGTDLEQFGEVIFDRGPLVPAMRASMSIPGFFVPSRQHGRIFIDGGFANPVPMMVCRDLGADRLIAVNVLSAVDYRRERIANRESSNKDYGVRRVLARTIVLAASRLIEYETTLAKPDLLINVDMRKFSYASFENAAEAIERGYAAGTRHQGELAQFVLK